MALWHLACLLVLGAIAFTAGRSLRKGLATFRKNSAVVAHIPGYRIFLHPHAIFSAWTPRWAPYFNIGEQYTWRYKHELFKQYNSDLISVVSYLPHTRSIVTCDPESIKFIVADRKRFIKPLGMYQPLAMFGPNVGVSEGTEWTRHRRIVASSNFLDNINQLAYENTVKTLDACFEDWEDKMKQTGMRQVKVVSVVQLTLKLALFVILGAAFSEVPPWDDDSPAALPKGHTLSFRHSLHGVLEGVWWKIVLPKFVYSLPFCGYFRHVNQSFDEFGSYLVDMIRDRRQQDGFEQTRGKKDLLGALIAASADSEDGDAKAEKTKNTFVKLSDQEVMGNIYVFLLAGHDTTAHTLAFTFGLLALYPHVQEELYRSILTVLPDLADKLAYDKIPMLDYSLAVFMETLRIYPSVVVVPKYSMENTFVPVQSFSLDGGKTPAFGGPRDVLVPQWAEVMIDVVGLHYNRKYWGEDASSFRPSRFVDKADTGYKWPREAFMGFSRGARSCLGQKFAQVEAVTIITEFIRRYEVHIDESVLRAGEDVEAARKRLLDGCKTVITLTPKALPVVFRERR